MSFKSVLSCLFMNRTIQEVARTISLEVMILWKSYTLSSPSCVTLTTLKCSTAKNSAANYSAMPYLQPTQGSAPVDLQEAATSGIPRSKLELGAMLAGPMIGMAASKIPAKVRSFQSLYGLHPRKGFVDIKMPKGSMISHASWFDDIGWTDEDGRFDYDKIRRGVFNVNPENKVVEVTPSYSWNNTHSSMNSIQSGIIKKYPQLKDWDFHFVEEDGVVSKLRYRK